MSHQYIHQFAVSNPFVSMYFALCKPTPLPYSRLLNLAFRRELREQSFPPSFHRLSRAVQQFIYFYKKTKKNLPFSVQQDSQKNEKEGF